MRMTSSPAAKCRFALALSVAIAGCGKIAPKEQPDLGRQRAEVKRSKTTCASAQAYDRLKNRLFDEVIARRQGSPANLNTLADYSAVRMENPVVEGRDEALDLTRCRGRFILEIPPGAERAFAGQRRLYADIAYSAQAAADGTGMVYSIHGAEPLIAQLATFNLTTGAYRPPPAIDDQPGNDQVAPEFARVTHQELSIQPPSDDPQQVKRTGRLAADQARRELDHSEQTSRKMDVAAREEGPRLHHGGEETVRRFYAALRSGDGTTASAQVIPEKRSSRAFSPDAIGRFYGKLAEPIRLTGLVPMPGGTFRVSYRYSAGRSQCNGAALVNLTRRGDSEYIRSIRALNGC